MDALINSRIEICNKYKISFFNCISKKAAKNLHTEDIAVLFGNIIDNAIEATKNAESKIIHLDIAEKAGYVSVVLKNTYNEEFSSINLKTTKSDRTEHGFGVRNVKKIVEKRQGMIEYKTGKNGMFMCNILLPKRSEVSNSTKNILNSAK